jgi:hypothetical protein
MTMTTGTQRDRPVRVSTLVGTLATEPALDEHGTRLVIVVSRRATASKSRMRRTTSGPASRRARLSSLATNFNHASGRVRRPDLTIVNRPANGGVAAGNRFSGQFEAPLRPGVYEVRYHMRSQDLLAKAALVVR